MYSFVLCILMYFFNIRVTNSVCQYLTGFSTGNTEIRNYSKFYYINSELLGCLRFSGDLFL